jgi:hypothetical protein
MADGRWPAAKAVDWYEAQPWLVGCNYIPSTAVNQLEMWQEPTFDPITIDRELGWAAGLGFNTVRVYLHDLVWSARPYTFKARIERFLQIASDRGIRVMLVLFDDCWNDSPKLGSQPSPVPGVHNSGWLRSPGSKAVTDPSTWPRLKRYVQGVIDAFGQDGRVLAWDLWNEPGNNGMGEQSLPLLEATFAWARAVGPAQPLTAGIWFHNEALNASQLGASDVITFHNYLDADSLSVQIAELKAMSRPVICTEYMARPFGSLFATHLPIFQGERVGCYNWGLVSGKTQTIYPWGSAPGGLEPELWFHDVFRQDGSPFDPEEVVAIRRATGKLG